MKENELRIGNWVRDPGGKEWFIEEWERPGKVAAPAPLLYEDPVFGKQYGHPLTGDVEYLKPIPLTEEWLLRLGFEQFKDGTKRFFNYSFMIQILEDRFAVYVLDRIIKSVIYVHELQNLHFAITGEELKTKHQ